jgi:hypothetical protein
MHGGTIDDLRDTSESAAYVLVSLYGALSFNKHQVVIYVINVFQWAQAPSFDFDIFTDESYYTLLE